MKPISTNDRLPEEHVYVLWWHPRKEGWHVGPFRKEGGRYAPGYFGGDSAWYICDGPMWWMPKPPPPESEQSVSVQPVELWVDGGTMGGNPGLGYGSWAFDDVHEYREFGEVITNNVSEYVALLHGLKAVAEHHDVAEVELTVKTDSQLVVGQLAEGWRVNAAHLRLLWLEARGLLKAFSSWGLVHVPGETMKQRIGH